MTPYIITAPTDQPVSLADMKAHLRTVHDDDDADISAKIAGAVASLDGWGGILGRCIMPQTWAIDVTGPGPHLLPFPEATDVTAEGVTGALDVTVKRSAAGPMVTIDGAQSDAEAVIEFASAIGETRLPAVQSLVKLMVQREFDQLAGPDAVAIDMAIGSLVTALRWRRV
jgi:hypothetical protein